MDWTDFPAFVSFETIPARTFCTTRRIGASLSEYGPGDFRYISEIPKKKEPHINLTFFATRLSISPDKIFFLKQVHGSHIVSIDTPFVEKRFSSPPLEGDAMISSLSGIALVLFLADCVGILLYSPEKGVSAVCHSGWRGSAENICGKVVDKMVNEWGCTPETLVAGISPSICGRCYEVGEEIVEQFTSYPDAIMHKNRRYFLDLPAIVTAQMVTAGMNPDSIEQSRICTKENSHLWYSHREEKDTGRFMLGIIR
ncbi:MAG: polyphenol oxidase family protein [Candidatus Ratteibacteria bacterium]